MSQKQIEALNFLRNFYKKVFFRGYTGMNVSNVDFTGQAASDVIKNILLSDKPASIVRFGSVEMDCLVNYLSIKKHKGDFLAYIKNEIDAYWWKPEYLQKMLNNAGFFPVTPALLEQFAELMIADMKEVDVLGSWLDAEKHFANELKGAIKIRITDIQPYHHPYPWSQALEGKKVLVVHPFEKSIKAQYSNRTRIFKDQNILPQFELKTVKAVQSIANSKTPFDNWFQALDYMKEKIEAVDFDVAILGCGAYGFPLAVHIKRLGKKAIHMGGATQVMFGIKGKRWEEEAGNDYVKKMYMNEHWIRPLSEEIPQNSASIEGGCYW